MSENIVKVKTILDSKYYTSLVEAKGVLTIVARKKKAKKNQFLRICDFHFKFNYYSGLLYLFTRYDKCFSPDVKKQLEFHVNYLSINLGLDFVHLHYFKDLKVFRKNVRQINWLDKLRLALIFFTSNSWRMLKTWNRFKHYLKVCYYLKKEQKFFQMVLPLNPFITDHGKDVEKNHYVRIESDIICLALGRWLYFKHLHLPEHTIGLDKDAESLLDQYTWEELDGRSKRISEYTLDQVKMKSDICLECVERAITIKQYLKENAFIKN